jgi:hypothetical protein
MWWHAPFLLKTVIVSLQSDDSSSLRGVAWQLRGAWLVLRKAELLRPGSAPVPMDGDVIVPRANVAFIQVL